MRDPTDPVNVLRRENQALRSRVADLERRLALFEGSANEQLDEALGENVAERVTRLEEVERIAHLGSWIWDTTTDEVTWSSELYRILGYDPKHDQATTAAFFARVHPDDRERVATLSAQGVAEGVSQQVDYRVLRPDGTIRYVSMDGAMLFDGAGNLRRVVGTVLDVTDARLAAQEVEHSAQLLTEAQSIASVGSWSWDATSGRMDCSEQLREILGLDSDAEATASVLLDGIHPGDRDRLGRQLEDFVEATRAAPVAFRIVHPSQQVRTVLARSIVALNDAGEVIGSRGTLMDISDRVELEEQLRQSQKMEAIGRLAGGLAHDFNNLLTVIMGNLDFLGMKGNTSRELHDIRQAAESATSLTQQLLAFSRRAVLSPSILNLNEVVTSTRRLIERTIGEDVVIELQLATNLWQTRVDAAQIQQVLLNLVVNARDAMPDGGRILIATENVVVRDDDLPRYPQGTPGEFVLFRVKDTGLGMDAETQASAFEPFFTTKQPGQGTGLGLAMVFGAVTQSGGFVELFSEPGQGTAFELYFPRAQSEAVSHRASPSPPSAEPLQGTVLLVDDDLAVARVVSTQLGNAGFEVELATRPTQAIQLCHQAAPPYDIIVSDLVMPEMRGTDMVREIRKQNPEVPVLFMTGYAPSGWDPTELRRVALIRKPFRARELTAAVSDLLKRSKLRPG